MHFIYISLGLGLMFSMYKPAMNSPRRRYNVDDIYDKILSSHNSELQSLVDRAINIAVKKAKEKSYDQRRNNESGYKRPQKVSEPVQVKSIKTVSTASMAYPDSESLMLKKSKRIKKYMNVNGRILSKIAPTLDTTTDGNHNINTKDKIKYIESLSQEVDVENNKYFSKLHTKLIIGKTYSNTATSQRLNTVADIASTEPESINNSDVASDDKNYANTDGYISEELSKDTNYVDKITKKLDLRELKVSVSNSFESRSKKENVHISKENTNICKGKKYTCSIQLQGLTTPTKIQTKQAQQEIKYLVKENRGKTFNNKTHETPEINSKSRKNKKSAGEKDLKNDQVLASYKSNKVYHTPISSPITKSEEVKKGQDKSKYFNEAHSVETDEKNNHIVKKKNTNKIKKRERQSSVVSTNSQDILLIGKVNSDKVSTEKKLKKKVIQKYMKNPIYIMLAINASNKLKQTINDSAEAERESEETSVEIEYFDEINHKKETSKKYIKNKQNPQVIYKKSPPLKKFTNISDFGKIIHSDDANLETVENNEYSKIKQSSDKIDKIYQIVKTFEKIPQNKSRNAVRIIPNDANKLFSDKDSSEKVVKDIFVEDVYNNGDKNKFAHDMMEESNSKYLAEQKESIASRGTMSYEQFYTTKISSSTINLATQARNTSKTYKDTSLVMMNAPENIRSESNENDIGKKTTKEDEEQYLYVYL